MPVEINYDQQHLKNLEGLYLRKIEQLYATAAREAASIASGIGPDIDPTKLFNFADYPQTKQKADRLFRSLTNNLTTTLRDATAQEWDLASKKNNQLVNRVLKSTAFKRKEVEHLYNRNLEALAAFQSRKSAGLNLSERIWKYSNQLKGELEMGIDVGLSDGRSASQLSLDLRHYLKEPNNLYRRVRDSRGELALSQQAQKYSPGPGTYRSSYKNSMRLARTEVNMAYRQSDHERWKQLDFVVGFEVRRSNHVFICPMCDSLVGKYPKDFKFYGWHPQCRCHALPILSSTKEFIEREKQRMAGQEVGPVQSANQITDLPASFKKWVTDHQDQYASAKSEPYFVRNNRGYVNGIEQAKRERLNYLGRAVKANLETDKLHRLPDGSYTPERTDLHNSIIESIAGKESTHTGNVFMLGGPPANGKSTLVKSGKLPHPKQTTLVDPDAIKAMIPEYNEMLQSGRKNLIEAGAAFTHEESSYLSKKIQEQMLKNRKDFVLDGVNDGEFNKVRIKIAKLKEAGNRVRADYVSLDYKLSRKLAKERAERTGRKVATKFVRDMNHEVSVLVPKLIESGIIDELYLWDTNINGLPRLVLKQIDGKLEIIDIKLYRDFLRKARR